MSRAPMNFPAKLRHTGLTASFGLILAALLGSTISQAGVVIETLTFDTFSGNPALAIPDGDVFGTSDERVVTSSISNLGKVEVGLTVSGTFNGDLYIYLRHDDGFSVLLNRPGLSSALPSGYEDAGLAVTFADDAAGAGFHSYRDTTTPSPGTAITGTWKPDGLTVTPFSSPATYDSATPTSGLGSFGGLNPNGTWTLYAADLSGGMLHQIESWSLTFYEATPVPEPGEVAAVIASLLVAWSGLAARDTDDGRALSGGSG